MRNLRKKYRKTHRYNPNLFQAKELIDAQQLVYRSRILTKQVNEALSIFKEIATITKQIFPSKEDQSVEKPLVPPTSAEL